MICEVVNSGIEQNDESIIVAASPLVAAKNKVFVSSNQLSQPPGNSRFCKAYLAALISGFVYSYS